MSLFQIRQKQLKTALHAKFFPRVIVFIFTHYFSFTEVRVSGLECWLLGCVYGIMVFS